MKNVPSFFGRIFKAGLTIMLPIVVTIVLISKALTMVRPLAVWLESNTFGSGHTHIDYPYLISWLIILVLILLLGIIGASVSGNRALAWFEDRVLVMMPGYKMLKSSLHAAVGLESEQNLPVVLIKADGWMLAFEMDQLENDEVVVFVPGSPDSRSGNVIIVNRADTRKTKLTQKQALDVLRQTGVGLRAVGI